MPVSCLDDLATGCGGPGSVRLLLAGERSRRLLLLRHLLDLASAHPEMFGDLPRAEAVWRDLDTIERACPEALGDVLMHPQVGIWLSSTIRALRAGRTTPPPWTEVGQVHALVLAAAARAGVALATRVPVHSGHVVLPTLGLARFATDAAFAVADTHTADGHTVLRLGDDQITVPNPQAAEPTDEDERWWDLRQLVARADDHELRVWLDDIDRYRNLADPVPPARMAAEEVHHWAAMLGNAWQLLCREWPKYAEALAAGFASISPLPVDPESRLTHSASTGDGFGAALISPPTDGVSLAVALVHEFQHIKLGGLMHLVPLHDDDLTDRLYAPWRDDPRPFAGLFQGVYAFLGIAMFWQRHLDAGPLAQFEFAYARRQTSEALQTLALSDRLTGSGRRFVDGMRATVQALASVRIPRALRRAAWAAAADHRAVWRLRNRSLPEEEVAALVAAWRAGGAAPRPVTDLVTPMPADDSWRHRRIVLYRTRTAAPHRFAAWAADPDTIGRKVANATAADLALVDGDHDGARSAYLRQIAADPDDVNSWVGLGLALAAAGRPEWRPLLREPHVVHAVHRDLRRDGPPADPFDLARWLAQGPLATAESGRYRSPRGGSATR